MSRPHPFGVSLALSAACFEAAGAALLVAPTEVAHWLGTGAGGPLVQPLGAALIGFAAMNWVARASSLGGIYGRAVVIGNQTHLTVGALLLVNAGVDAGIRQPAYWALTAIYGLGAACSPTWRSSRPACVRAESPLSYTGPAPQERTMMSPSQLEDIGPFWGSSRPS